VLVRAEAHSEQVLEYVAAYQRAPEDAGEVEAARALSIRSLAGLPWDARRGATK
jgi:hypothetical protein